MPRPKRMGARKTRARRPRAISTRRPAPRASSRPRANMKPTDVNPIWALYRNIGDRISSALKGK